MSRLTERLTERAEALNLSQTQIADSLGMSQQSINALFKGRVAFPRRWVELADLLGIPHGEMRDLMTEAADELADEPKLIRDRTYTTLARQPRIRPVSNAQVLPKLVDHRSAGDRMIPVLGEAVGGSDGEYLFNGQVLDYIASPPSLANVRDAYAIYIDGESMVPRFKPGETLYVHPAKPARRGDDVIVQLRPTSDGSPPRGYVKEFVGWSGTELLLRQHNPAGEVRFARDDVVSVHPIILAGKY